MAGAPWHLKAFEGNELYYIHVVLFAFKCSHLCPYRHTRITHVRHLQL